MLYNKASTTSQQRFLRPTTLKFGAPAERNSKDLARTSIRHRTPQPGLPCQSSSATGAGTPPFFTHLSGRSAAFCHAPPGFLRPKSSFLPPTSPRTKLPPAEVPRFLVVIQSGIRFCWPAWVISQSWIRFFQKIPHDFFSNWTFDTNSSEFQYGANSRLEFTTGSRLDPDWIPTGSRLDPDWIPIGSRLDLDWARHWTHKKKSTNTSERQTPQDLLWKPPATARNLGPHQRRPYVFLEYPASLIKGEGRKKHTVKLISLLPDMNPTRAAAV